MPNQHQWPAVPEQHGILKGYRCEKCGSVSTERHQDWPCLGEEPENKQIFGKAIGGTPIGCGGGQTIDPITQGWIQAATYWWRLYYMLKDGKEPPVTLAIDEEFLREVNEREAAIDAAYVVIETFREAMAKYELDLSARKHGGVAADHCLQAIAEGLKAWDSSQAAEEAKKLAEAQR